MRELIAILIVASACSANADENVAATNVPPAVTDALPSHPEGPLSFSAQEVLRLAEASIDESVIVAFIEASPEQFALSADQIIYLKDLGVASSLVTAMLQRDAALAAQASESSYAASQPITAESTNTNPPSSAVYVTNAPPQVAHFYDALAPYGTWVQVDGIGWCWQPRAVVMDPGWRPYWNGGRWIYTESGWYWYSDYSWGWAPFHYGRWHLHAHSGWLWIPDLVWAPAWVCWRYSDVYCGWAPLPWGASFVVGRGFYFNGVHVGVNFDFHLGIDFFTFVPIGHFHDSHPHLHGVPRVRAGDVYRNTTVINNYVVGRNNTVVNHGVPVRRVAVASGREIRPAEIRETPADGRHVMPERLGSADNKPVLYRPQLPAATAPGARAQRIDPQHPVVAHPRIAPRERRMTSAGPAASGPRAPAATQPPGRLQRPESVPARPQPTPGRPGSQPRSAPGIPGPRSVPARPAAPAESPRAREQRLSNGRGMAPAPARPSPHSVRPDRPREKTTHN